MLQNRTSSTSSPQDSIYVLFLWHYIFVIIFFDSIPLYPPKIVPKPLLSLHAWYKVYFNDQLLIAQPPWFRFFSLTEALYQLPVTVWGIWALRSKSYKAPAYLLMWSLVCCGTTITCMFEFYDNKFMSGREKIILIVIYGLYGITFGVIGLDMFSRIQRTLKTVNDALGRK